MFVSIIVWLFSSAYFMKSCESEKHWSYWDSLYFTWITMTTVGYGDLTPSGTCGRVLASLDGLVGIILIGAVVWLITTSLTRK
jgi:Ion channel